MGHLAGPGPIADRRTPPAELRLALGLAMQRPPALLMQYGPAQGSPHPGVAADWVAAPPLGGPDPRRQEDDAIAITGGAAGGGELRRQHRCLSPTPETTDVVAHGLDNFSFSLETSRPVLAPLPLAHFDARYF